MGARYREMEIRTASPEMVIVKLYEGAIRFIRNAKGFQEEGAVAHRATAIGKALAIVNELQNSLNLEDGGEIATNLDALYVFVSERLLEANARGSVQALDEASKVLTTLNEAWVAISRGSVDFDARRIGDAVEGSAP